MGSRLQPAASIVRQGFAAGHLLGLGVVTAGAIALYGRFVPNGRRYTSLVLFAAFLALAFAILPRDLSNFYARQEEAGSAVPWPWIAPLLAAAVAVGCAAIARKLSRRFWRWLSLAAGVGIVLACELGPLRDYSGVLLFAIVVASLFLSSGLRGLALPRPRGGRRSLIASRVVGAAVVGASLFSVLVTPRPSVWRSLFEVPGSVLAPQIARLRPRSSSADAASSLARSDWFKPRDKVPSIPASVPPLVPRDAIVLFLTVDSMRGDIVQGDRFARELPNFFQIRDQAVNFEMARAPSPATVSTITALFSGKYYSQIYWTSPKPNIKSAEEEPVPFLAEILSKGGVRTVQVAATNSAWKRGGGRGFQSIVQAGRGFTPANKAMNRLLGVLKKDATGPLFLYLHFSDPHAPYEHGKKGDPKFLRYVAEVSFVDRQIGRLVRYLKRTGLFDRTVFIFSADHGEGFGEHGQYTHCYGNYDEVVHVPLIVRVPGVPPRSIATPVSGMDIRPTILDLLGFPTPGTDMGQSLVPYLRGEDPVLTRPIAMDAGRRIQAMVFPDNIKVIHDLNTESIEVYDMTKDPGEQEDLADDPRFGAGEHVQALKAFFDTHTLRKPGYTPPWRKF